MFTAFLEERLRWFLWLPVLIACGIGTYFILDFEPSLLCLGFSPLLAGLAFLARNNSILQPVSAVFLTVALGFNAAQIESWAVRAPLLRHPMKATSITGRLMHADVLPENKTRLLLKDLYIKGLPKEETPRYIRVKTKVPLAELLPAGKIINVWGPLWPPGESVAPRAYDFRRHSYFQQLGGTAVAYAGPRLRKTESPPFFWDGFSLVFENMRRELLNKSYQHLSGPEADMTATLLSGSQSSIDQEVMKAVRASGLSHLLSISGIHVSMFALLVYVPLRFFLALVPMVALRFHTKKIAALAAIFSTASYVMLVGPETPTVRSALMTAIVLFAVITDRKAMSMRLVALAAMVIMLLAPSAVIGPSFQMSFAAVLAMVAFYEKRLDHAIKEGAGHALPRWLKKIGQSGKDIILTSLIATAATTPFALFHFQSFSFYGVFANMIAIPLTSFWVMPMLLLTYITVPLGLEGPFIKAAGFGVALIIDVAREVSHWPYARIDMPLMPYTAFFMAIGGGFWLCLWQRKWRFVGLVPLTLACLYPFYATQPDVFIAAEKDVWAVQTVDQKLLLHGKKKMGFLPAQWKQLANARWVTFLKAPRNNVFWFEKEGVKIAFLLNEASFRTNSDSCQKADIVVASFPLETCAARYVIDEEALQQKGGHSLFFSKGKINIQTVKTGGRPWTIQYQPIETKQDTNGL